MGMQVYTKRSNAYLKSRESRSRTSRAMWVGACIVKVVSSYQHVHMKWMDITARRSYVKLRLGIRQSHINSQIQLQLHEIGLNLRAGRAQQLDLPGALC